MERTASNPIVLSGATYESKPFVLVRILEDNTVLNTLDAKDNNDLLIDCLSLLGITTSTQLPAGTEIKSPIQFPFAKVTPSAGSVQVECEVFQDLP